VETLYEWQCPECDGYNTSLVEDDAPDKLNECQHCARTFTNQELVEGSSIGFEVME